MSPGSEYSFSQSLLGKKTQKILTLAIKLFCKYVVKSGYNVQCFSNENLAKLLLYFNYYISLCFQEELTYSLKQNHTEKILVTFTVQVSITDLLLLLLSRFIRVWLCATRWTAAPQAPLSTGFSRQEYWSRLPFHSPLYLITWSQFVFITAFYTHSLFLWPIKHLIWLWFFYSRNQNVHCWRA